ncbi:hypothetical protein A2U01_0114716, partial [Trifolium medium]|nr:hypothetical protein [Trifolium medium]
MLQVLARVAQLPAARCAIQGNGFWPWRVAQPSGARCAVVSRSVVQE